MGSRQSASHIRHMCKANLNLRGCGSLVVRFGQGEQNILVHEPIFFATKNALVATSDLLSSWQEILANQTTTQGVNAR